MAFYTCAMSAGFSVPTPNPPDESSGGDNATSALALPQFVRLQSQWNQDGVPASTLGAADIAAMFNPSTDVELASDGAGDVFDLTATSIKGGSGFVDNSAVRPLYLLSLQMGGYGGPSAPGSVVAQWAESSGSTGNFFGRLEFTSVADAIGDYADLPPLVGSPPANADGIHLRLFNASATVATVQMAILTIVRLSVSA